MRTYRGSQGIFGTLVDRPLRIVGVADPYKHAFPHVLPSRI